MVASEGSELYFTGSNTDSIKTAYYFSPLILTRDSHGCLHSDDCIAVHPSSIITATICQRVRSVAFFSAAQQHSGKRHGVYAVASTMSMLSGLREPAAMVCQSQCPNTQKFIPSPQLSYNVNRVDTELAGYGWFSATDHVVDSCQCTLPLFLPLPRCTSRARICI
jgi:hypothetical protein